MKRLILLCLLGLGGAPLSQSAVMEALRVSDNHRFLVTADGRPFFWLGDTAWELFHRLDRAEAELYLADRAAKGFTVVQAVAVAELDGLTEPNRRGQRPLVDRDPARPDVKPGPDNDYGDFVDEVVDLAAAQGLRIGFLPTWGKYVTSSAFDGKVDGIFNVTNALAYGRFLGQRYRDRSHLIWILGGDKALSTPEAVAIWRAMARGIAEGVSGRENDSKVLLTYHTAGPGHVSDFLHDEPWLDFTSAQSSHGDLVESWRFIEKHWARQPIKPVIDLESSYPDVLIPVAWLPESMRAAHWSTPPSNHDHARRAASWAVFAGAAGQFAKEGSREFVPPGPPGVGHDWVPALDDPQRGFGPPRVSLEPCDWRGFSIHRLHVTDVASNSTLSETPMNRRRFLMGCAASAASVFSLRAWAANDKRTRPPRILLRSSWQVVNIGDIAHTPGVVALLQKHIPEAEVRLWASGDLSAEVAAMEHKRFPTLKIVKGTIGADGKASNAELGDAVEWCDFLLHGSGPSMVAHKDVAAFMRHTGKPFGVYGITYGGFGTAERELLGKAQFACFRDSVSLARAKSDGIACPLMEFGPDGAFAADLRNDEAATVFLRAHQLEEGKFVCCIPRLRYTPYWTIHGREMTAEDQRKHERSEAMKEHDHAPLREAIAAVVRQTGLKVLICPEDKSQMAVGREMLLDKLPEDVRKGVVWRERFWLTDEALSTYVRSAGLFGLEMHSPIMAVGNGIPAIVCRFAEQTSKGFMWRDIGLGEWLFDMDTEDDRKRITPAVLEMIQDPAAARAKVKRAMDFVTRRQSETMGVLRSAARSRW